VAEGARDPVKVVQAAWEVLQAEPLLQVDYVEVVDVREMLAVESIEEEALLVLAVYAGATRLIDNAVLRT